jgi:hypothetical protein
MLLREQIESFKDVEPDRVQRDGLAYAETTEFITTELFRQLASYRKLTRITQRGRLIRDEIDDLIRRYHEYVIAGKIKAHYRQIGVYEKKGNVFEHVIPLRTVRNMLIAGVVTIDQALNAPTCLIKPDSNQLLSKNKLVKKTPNAWMFWQRYAGLEITVETHDGTPVDMLVWDLDQHYQYFKHLST